MIAAILKKILFIISLVFIASTSIAQDEKVSVDFETEIKPILESNCLRCHGESDPEGGYRIDISDEALEYVEVGDADGSDFFAYLISEEEDEMMPPPDDGGPLDDSDIELIKTWINEGANWPDGMKLVSSDQVETGDGKPAENLDGENQSDTEAQSKKNEANEPDVFKALGSLHPAAIHLPIGLLLAAGFFALLSLRGNFVMSDCAYYCLWLGTFGAIAACATGWWFVLDQRPSEYIEAQNLIEGLQNQDHKLFWHRTSALIATVFALLLALFAASARNRDPDDGLGWKLGLIILAMGIGLVGHQGGELTWKSSHYDELYRVIDQYIPGIMGDMEETDSDDATLSEKESATGDTSEDADSDNDVETLP